MDNNKRLKEKELEVLNTFDKVCKKYNLKYYLAYGTLLGAIRHDGFIPWDDDIDLHMISSDIVRLRNLLEKENVPGYYYQDKLTDKYYYNYWSKFGIENTTWMPKKRITNCKHGICLDIWPLFPANNNVFDRARVKIFTKIYVITSSKYYVLNREDANKLGKLFHKVVPNKLNDILYKISFNILSSKKKYTYYTMYSFEKEKNIYFKREDIEGDRKHIFEKKKYNIPQNTELYLETFYGDYMTPPEEKDRYGHDTGDSMIYDFENSYKKYMGDNNE